MYFFACKSFYWTNKIHLNLFHVMNATEIGVSYTKINKLENFVLKVYIVITSKVFADFRFESPISIDFQREILALLPPKSAKTFHESLQILSPLRKSA